MTELCRHIEAILLEHSCVIVPGLGGFVTQYVPARRVDEEKLMLPPYRSVAFNPCLTMNDGLLAQSYMYARGVTYSEALRLISEAVVQLENELRHSGRYELPGIGELCLNAAGRTEFHPEAAGVIAPELYGLDAFVLDPATDIRHSCRVLGNPSPVASEKHYTMRLSKELVHYIAVAVTAVAFYTIMVFPIKIDQGVPAGRLAMVVPNGELPLPVNTEMASDRTSVPVKKEKTLTALVSGDSAVVSEIPRTESVAADAVLYTIVLASQVAKKNAVAFVESFVRDGYNDVRVYERGRMRRVIYGTFPTEVEAHETLRRLRDDGRFDESWVMALK